MVADEDGGLTVFFLSKTLVVSSEQQFMDYSSIWTKCYLNIPVIQHYLFVWKIVQLMFMYFAIRFILNFAVKVGWSWKLTQESIHRNINHWVTVAAWLLFYFNHLYVRILFDHLCLVVAVVACHWSPAVIISSSWSICLYCSSSTVLSLFAYLLTFLAISKDYNAGWWAG